MSVRDSVARAYISVDLSEHDDATAWISHRPPGDTVRISAADLSDALHVTTRLRSEHTAAGRSSESLAVLLDIETHLAADPRVARKEVAATPARDPMSVRYVGTASGLVGLIADLHAVGVADGVTLKPILPTPIDKISADVADAVKAIDTVGRLTP